MNRLRTLTFAATTALAVMAFTLPGAQAQTSTQAQEQQAQERQAQEQQTGSRNGQMLRQQDRAALLDARMAGIRAGLNLSEEQNALFGPVEDAYRAMVESRQESRRERAQERRSVRGEMRDQTRQERAERRNEMRAGMRAGRAAQGDFLESLERRSADMTTRAVQLEDFTEAMRPFWESLDEDQRRLAPVLMHPRMGMGMRMGMESGMGERRGWRHGHHGARYGAPR
jgi:hypothetical protein